MQQYGATGDFTSSWFKGHLAAASHEQTSQWRLITSGWDPNQAMTSWNITWGLKKQPNVLKLTADASAVALTELQLPNTKLYEQDFGNKQETWSTFKRLYIVFFIQNTCLDIYKTEHI